jgi:polar amino acid transport system permease protein
VDFFAPALTSNFPFILSGFVVTIQLSLATLAATFVLGTILALCRLYGPRWLSLIVTFYIDTMRSIPEAVVMIWIFLSIPLLTSVSLSPFLAALLALTLQIAAYVAEMVRAGLQSLRRGQTQAGLTLGMSYPQILLKILLPQAIIRMLPNFGSVTTQIVKDTAIASLIAVPELLHNSDTLVLKIYRSPELFTIDMALYFIILFPLTRIVELFYRRVAHLGRS